jgi:hypothetical protein
MSKAVRTMLLAMLMALPIGSANPRAQEAAPSEYQVKAAFLYNFAKFVEWPSEAFASDSAPFVIGVLGQSPFGNDLESTIKGKQVKGRKLEIRMFASAADPDLKTCHILFICNSPKQRLEALLKLLKGSTVLTVSETENFTRCGGMINFVMEGNKVRFEINDDAAQNARLTISSKLLNLRRREGNS